MMKRILVIGYLASVLSSCEFSDKEAVEVPAYLYIPAATLQTKGDGTQGSSHAQFEDMWVTVNNTFIGSYGLPALIPIPRTGSVDIRIDAGVKKSLQDPERIVYPMWASARLRTELEPQEIDTFNPVFTYFESATFPFIEDYDRVGTRFTFNPLYTVPGDTILPFQGPQALEPGKNSGQLIISDASTVFQMYTTDEYTLPRVSIPVFLEMDFNSNVQLIVGYYASDNGAAQEVLRTFGTDGQWRKMYMAFNQEMAGRDPNTRYRFYIGLFKQPGQKADVKIDNIKLVYLD